MSKQHCAAIRDRLVKEAWDASIHFHVHMGLRRELRSERRAFDYARTFWATSLNGHLAATHLALVRLYDQHAKALALRAWLRAIRKTPGLLSQVPDPGVLEQDISRVEGKDPEVKLLVRFRNNIVAHVSATLALEPPKSASAVDLKLAHYESLIERAHEVISRYSVMLDGRDHLRLPFDHSDFKRVVAATVAVQSQRDA